MKVHVKITESRKGFRGQRAKYRVAVATSPDLLDLNGATSAARAAKAAGQLAIANGVDKWDTDQVARDLAKLLRA